MSEAKPPEDRWPEILPLLGTMPDAVLARRIGMNETTLNRRRQRLGIPAYRVPERKCLVCCLKAVARSGLCHMHNERWRRWGKPAIEEWVQAYREERLNICEICGRGWNGYHGSRTCSTDCDMERRRRLALERWNAKSDEYREEMMRRSLARNRARAAERKVEIVCSICQEPFVGHNFRKTCNKPHCQYEAVRRNSNEINKKRRQIVYAARLGKQLDEITNIEEKQTQ